MSFITPYENINKYDNFITFANGACFALISQTEKGSGRGKNIEDSRQFADCWNEIIRMKRKIAPFVSRDTGWPRNRERRLRVMCG